MSDVKCPYCGCEQRINHDGGYGREEDANYEQDCIQCGKAFNFKTIISFDYKVYCQDNDHDMIKFGYSWPDMYGCSKCDFLEQREQ